MEAEVGIEPGHFAGRLTHARASSIPLPLLLPLRLRLAPAGRRIARAKRSRRQVPISGNNFGMGADTLRSLVGQTLDITGVSDEESSPKERGEGSGHGGRRAGASYFENLRPASISIRRAQSRVDLCRRAVHAAMNLQASEHPEAPGLAALAISRAQF